MKEETKRLKGIITNKNKNTAFIVFLYGDLGSGKTTFTQVFGKSFKIKKNITSPTYQIRKDYKINENLTGFCNFTHIDLYRIEKKDIKETLKIIDLQNISNIKTNIIFIEWPNKAEKLPIEADIKMFFQHKSNKYIIDIKEV